MTTEWSFRVTPESLDDMVAQCSQLRHEMMPKAFLVTRETSSTDKPHLHGYIELVGRSRMQLDYALSRIFKVKGAGQKQVSDVRGQKGHGSTEKCLRYICKGESQTSPPDVVCSFSISDEDIASFHEQYWRVNEEVSRRPTSNPKKISMYDELKEVVKEEWSAEGRFDLMWQWYRSRQRHVSYHCFRDVVRKLCVEQDQSASDIARERLRDEIFGREIR